jgi:hypothetical protein
MNAKIDDVGSYPLPNAIVREAFNKAYRLAREAFANGRDPRQDTFMKDNFCDVTIDAFKQKCLSGLDVVNYPQ